VSHIGDTQTGMEKVSSKHHLCRRNGVFYYRRRVPTQLVDAFGKKTIQFSLKTSDLSEAKKPSVKTHRHDWELLNQINPPRNGDD
jgi:Domain of unknown function (DUF6538)